MSTTEPQPRGLDETRPPQQDHPTDEKCPNELGHDDIYGREAVDRETYERLRQTRDWS